MGGDQVAYGVPVIIFDFTCHVVLAGKTLPNAMPKQINMAFNL